jgi:hypothetical protein
VKSCGPDASTLASSVAEARSAQPGWTKPCNPQGDGGKRARSPGRARRKPLKPLRAGTPGDSGCSLLLVCISTNAKRTRGCGCHWHPAFPTPSLGGRFINASGAWHREVANACLELEQRHCERSEAIHLAAQERMDCFVASLLAMTVLQLNRRGCLKIESALLLERQPVAMSRPREGWSIPRALPKTAVFRVRLKA